MSNANKVFQESADRKNQNPKKYEYTIEEITGIFIKYLEEGMSK